MSLASRTKTAKIILYARESSDARKFIQHRFHFGTLLLDVVKVQPLDPAVRRATNAREGVTRFVTRCKDRVIFISKVAEICAQIHETGVREQLNRMSRLVHHEGRLKCEELKCRIVDIVRLMDRQSLQQRTVPGGQPAEFMEGVALGAIFLYPPEVPDIALGPSSANSRTRLRAPRG